MYVDTRGHAISTHSEQAAQACALAMDHYMERRSDVSRHLQHALECDPECAIAHALTGLMLHGAKHAAFKPLVADALKNARRYESGASAREKHFIDALDYAVSGQLNNSVGCFEAVLEQAPTDGFALSLCQAELFWLGDMPRSLAASSMVAKHWHASVPGYSEFLAIHAFDLEEAGLYTQAERIGREAVERVPENIWATHAVAHVLYMQGRHAEGVDWINGLQNHWQGLGQMQFHVWWHKCLFLLEEGDTAAALDGYDNWVRNTEHELVQAMPDLYIDLQNASSLLWRLEYAGVDVGARWQEMADLVAARVDDLANPFTSAHFAIILAAVGDESNCKRLIEAMQDFIVGADKTLCTHYRKAGLPAASAAIAHRQRDYSRVVSLLYPVRGELWMMGGSHAQQDIFFQMLVDAAAHIGDVQMVRLLMREIEQIGFVEPVQFNAYKHVSRCLA